MARGSDGELGNVYAFPDLKKKASCGDCEYVMFGQYGFYCSFYKEEIVSENVAEDCEEYLPFPIIKER